MSARADLGEREAACQCCSVVDTVALREVQAAIERVYELCDKEDARVAEFNAKQDELDKEEPRPAGFPPRFRIGAIVGTAEIRKALS